MKFEWDPFKAESNLLKHGVAFQDAQTCFYDKNALEFDDLAHSQKEARFVQIAKTNKGIIIFVSFTYRRGKIRIISARKASSKEKETYERQ